MEKNKLWGFVKLYNMELDKFYTKKEIAKELISYLDVAEYDKIIEPSAGNGSFSKQIKNMLCFVMLLIVWW